MRAVQWLFTLAATGARSLLSGRNPAAAELGGIAISMAQIPAGRNTWRHGSFRRCRKLPASGTAIFDSYPTSVVFAVKCAYKIVILDY